MPHASFPYGVFNGIPSPPFFFPDPVIPVQSFFRAKRVAIPLLATALAVSGCGGSSPSGDSTVVGSVTIDGGPLEDGTIIFYDGPQAAGVGTIDSGSYSMKQSASVNGMAPGDYKVSVESWEIEPGSVTEEGEIVGEGKSRIPELYGDVGQSGLTATVNAGSNEIDFDLKSN